MNRLSRWALKVARPFLSGARIARLSGVKFGSDCRILSKNFGSEPFLISLGDRVTISSEVTFINHDGSGWLVRDEQGRRFLYRRIEIGSDVFIGARAILMPGIRVGNRVVVGAGSVVTRSIPDGCVVAGNPARYLCSYEDFAQRVSSWRTSQQMRNDADYRTKVLEALDPDFKPLISGQQVHSTGKAHE
jgi:acetyltransferase-like isoleucine patch superfamily enzyme